MVPSALILDFGGVLTTDLWDALRACSRRDGLPEQALIDYLTRDTSGSALMRDLERGAIGQAQFEQSLANSLGIEANGLLARMAADLRPNEEMLQAADHLRRSGVNVAVLSNSWGSDYFDPYAPWNLDKHADVVVFSDQVHLRKPDAAIFELTAKRLGVPPVDCVFVDDVAAYADAARQMGMSAIHHVDTVVTLTEISRLFGRELLASTEPTP